jgi:DNA-binding GntR family transcriptional regulator
MISVEKSLMKTHHCAGLARTGHVAKAAPQREFSVAKFSASNIRQLNLARRWITLEEEF